MVAAKKIGTLLITAFVIFLAGCAGGGESKNSQQLNTYAALEREVFSEINLARTRPLGYAKILEERRQHFSGKVYYKPGMKYQLRTFEGVFAVDDAIRALKRQRPLNPLNLSKGMTKAARDHVDDMGTNGLIGHTGSDGSKFTERLSRYGSGSFLGENISYGESKGRQVVIQQLIDDGVQSRGHRKNIYNESYAWVGIACGPHQKYRASCVINFAKNYSEKR